MVAVRSNDAERFARDPPPDVWLLLVHGSDAGLISELVRTLVVRAVEDPKDPFQLVRLTGDDLASDPGRLLDETGTVPLFGGRRAVLVELGSKNISGVFEAVLAGGRPDACTVIVDGGNLKRDAPVRRLFERARGSAALECGADSREDLARLISQKVGATALTIDDDAREALVELLGVDRLTTRSELEKLLLYAHGQARIATEDVEAIVSNASATTQDRAVDAAFLGDHESVETTLGRALAEGGDPGVLLGAALRHAFLLHRSRLEVENRRSVADAAQGATRYGLFFKRKPAFEAQLKIWSSDKLLRSLQTISGAVAQVRREPRLARAIATRALWSVATAAGAPQ